MYCIQYIVLYSPHGAIIFQGCSNELQHDVQHAETMIYAKSGKNLFNISKVIGRKNKVAPFFSRPYSQSRYWYTVASICRSSLSSVTLCIVAKRCVLEQKLLLRAYSKLYMRNRLVPK